METRNEASIVKAAGLGQRLFFKLLDKIRYGRVNLLDKESYSIFGDHSAPETAAVSLRVNHPRAYARILAKGSIGAAEAYMEEDWDSDDLSRLIELIIVNQELFKRLESPFAKILNYGLRFLGLFTRNTVSRAKKNIIAHYDLGNELFELFLDPTMMYSSAIFEAQDQPLESASLKKLDEICQRLKLNKEDHVLEIGSGWGGFAIHAASHYGCKITTTTISEKQYSYVKAKVQALGLADRIEVINKDYRILEGTYDKLVSIEMIEAIGFKYFDTFFEKCNSLLKDGGSFLLQAITINDQSYSSAKNEIDFIKKYIFPGGCLPSIQTMFDSVARKTSLQLLHARELGQDYALTLEAWRKRFHQKINEVRELGYSDKFIRMWEFYFCYCIAAFRQGYISDFHLLWKKRA